MVLKNCPYCGKFMEFDYEHSIKSGDDIRIMCSGKHPCIENYIDYEATDRMWDEIDYDRFQDDHRWLNELGIVSDWVNK